VTAEEFLETIRPRRDQIERFLDNTVYPDNNRNNGGYHYDAELGWLLKDSVRNGGRDGVRTFYNYETHGARQSSLPIDSCRVHTYGNSFTHCDQVSNGETWQEFLGYSFGERLENYGIGGHSVYQAYRRMLKIEQTRSVDHIILNIWADDHYRNLDAWRNIRARGKSACGWPLPHLSVDLEQNTVAEHENVCGQPEDLFKLMDPGFCREHFAQDPVLAAVLAVITDDSTGPNTGEFTIPVHGLPRTASGVDSQRTAALRDDITRQALRATQWIVEKTENYCRTQNKKLLIILSYAGDDVLGELAGRERFDESFHTWLTRRRVPVIDLLQEHARDFQRYRISPEEYVGHHFIGHYAPAGNFFVAQCLRRPVAEWLAEPDNDKQQDRPQTR